MNCTELRHDLEAALDNAVDETTKHSIELHLASCDSCRGHLDHLEALGKMLRENIAINVPASLDQRVLSSFTARYALGETGVSRWRNVLLGSFSIPAPVVGLFLLTALGAVALSYWVGKQNATSMILVAPPAQLEHAMDRGTPITNQSARDKPDHRQTAISTPKKAEASRSKFIKKMSAQLRATTQQIRSSTTINANSATYSSVAFLPDFEPLSTATARIIKGGKDK